MKELIKKFDYKKFIMLNLGIIAASIGVSFFMWPKSLVLGGASGLAILLELLIPQVNNTIFLYIINIVLLIVSLFTLGKKYFIDTLYASLLLPTCNLLFQFLINHFGWYEALQSLELWIAILGSSISMGVGIGLALKQGGSTGGLDIIQSILFKYLHIQYSTSSYIMNGLIIIGGAFINGLEPALAAIIYLFIFGFVTDSVTFGGFNKRAVFIQTVKEDEVSDLIMNKMLRGLSLVDMEGGYTKNKRHMLVCICYTREYLELRNEIEKIDPSAFIFVTRAMEVRGLGFSEENTVRKLRIKENKEQKQLEKNKEE